jgi:hypothetical protein
MPDAERARGNTCTQCVHDHAHRGDDIIIALRDNRRPRDSTCPTRSRRESGVGADSTHKALDTVYAVIVDVARLGDHRRKARRAMGFEIPISHTWRCGTLVGLRNDAGRRHCHALVFVPRRWYDVTYPSGVVVVGWSWDAWLRWKRRRVCGRLLSTSHRTPSRGRRISRQGSRDSRPVRCGALLSAEDKSKALGVAHAARISARMIGNASLNVGTTTAAFLTR